MKQFLLTLTTILLCILPVSECFAVYYVGDTVADFTLPDSDGTSVSLHDFTGLAILIYFWGDC